MSDDIFHIEAGPDHKAKFQLLIPVQYCSNELFRDISLTVTGRANQNIIVKKSNLQFEVELIESIGSHKYTLTLKKKNDQIDTREITVTINSGKKQATKIERPGNSENRLNTIVAIIGTQKKYTKFQSLALEEDNIFNTVYDFELTRDKNSKIILSSYSGIIVFTVNALIKDHIANANEFGLIRIKEYLENGGKVCFLLQPLSSEQNSKLIEHFGVTTIEEFIVGEGPGKGDVKFSMDGNKLCPLFNCKIGTHLISKSNSSGAPGSYTGPFIGCYLNMRKSAIILEKATIQSEKSNLERVVSCKIKQGAGEAWYISDFTGLYAGSVRVDNYDLFSDTSIDNFQNTEAARAIIKWLSDPVV